MKIKTGIIICFAAFGAVMTSGADVAVIDNFDDGDVSDYITVVMLDTGNTAIHNVSALEAVGGTVQVATDTYYDIEQTAYIKPGYHLEVGQEIRLDYVPNGGSRAMGLFAGLMPTENVRANYINIYAEAGSINTRGFNGTTEMNLQSMSGAVYTTMFIRRDGEYDYVAGVYDASGSETILKDRNELIFGGTSDIVIGLYTDIRSTGTLGVGDNLTIGAISIPPVIISNPGDAAAMPSENASFETVFTSQTTPSAEWYKVAWPGDLLMESGQPDMDVQLLYDPQNDQYTSMLSITNLTTEDSGQYYCRVINDFGIPAVSTTADLVVRGLVYYWTLDMADYTGTHYADVAGGKDAQVESAAVFTAGADQAMNGAVQIRPEGGWATVDANNPLVLSGAFTISYWANWQEQIGSSDNLLIDSNNGTIIEIPDGLQADHRWQHICAVFDGGQCRLFLDGVLAGQSEWVMPQGMMAELNIGSAEMGSGAFNGHLDDIRIYNYAMNAFEVAQLRFDFSGARSCMFPYGSSADWSGPQGVPDCTIDLYDLNLLANQYLSSNSLYDISGPLNQPDEIVSFYDFAWMASVWLDCGLYPDCP
jgi:hypothetical protein